MHWCKCRLYKQKTVTNPECQGKEAPDRQHSMHCILISMWLVPSKLCWVHCRHLHQCISEHRYSAIGKHHETQHGNNRTKTDHLLKVLSKCNSKFDCLVYEMLYIKDIKPSLNMQADSIHAKLFTWHFRTFFFSLIVFLTLGFYPLDRQIF